MIDLNDQVAAGASRYGTIKVLKNNPQAGDRKFITFHGNTASLRMTMLGDDIADVEGLWEVVAVKADGLEVKYLHDGKGGKQ